MQYKKFVVYKMQNNGVILDTLLTVTLPEYEALLMSTESARYKLPLESKLIVESEIDREFREAEQERLAYAMLGA